MRCYSADDQPVVVSVESALPLPADCPAPATRLPTPPTALPASVPPACMPVLRRFDALSSTQFVIPESMMKYDYVKYYCNLPYIVKSIIIIATDMSALLSYRSRSLASYYGTSPLTPGLCAQRILDKSLQVTSNDKGEVSPATLADRD